MIALDSSAIVAILLGEPEASAFRGIVAQGRCLIGAPTLCEARMALNRRLRNRAAQALERIVADGHIEVVSFDETMSAIGIDAFNRYGKGRGHPAQLNFGDCLSYAVAKSRGLPLLFKGNDFGRTDLVPAYAPTA
ncbi:type II toxin-antitoxin system VapC family toxin [Methylobacterium sp. J-076]|uniref:type II toxin-antitoxin system VapC family toxin n=1 Tax=Methylobacterium sp. J-076 TaxID=2836655 RepID=UPI001FB900C9|nr:type II toxin-antitoxin system VapC family toxin [Methylobacterium sp. J-076]MCJ2015065.1 type II toxin-antitoxin system VapC family toxin [Methylobacterium sp. J-076]